jgi:hypothetical protein
MESIAPGALLGFGLLFPVVSFLSMVASATQSTREHHVSPILIPFIGPLLLSSWVIVGHRPLWWIPIIWVCDLGTVLFLIAAPLMIRWWWGTSNYTLAMELRGDSGIESVVVRLHQNGRYSMFKTWRLEQDQKRTSGLGEPGTYTEDDEVITLVSHLGMKRVLTPDEEDNFIVEEQIPDRADLERYSLQGWTLTAVTTEKKQPDRA